MLPKTVKLVEVGPRDGLQNEKVILSVETKVELINRLSETGLPVIECGSFVSPKWVPQMANTEEIFALINKKPNVQYTALVPNERGCEAAIRAKVDAISIFTAVSESFAQKNINCSIEESFERFKPIMVMAQKKNIPVRGYISCVFGCPYEGKISINQVLPVVKRLDALGCYEISLGDTIGVATPGKVKEILTAILDYIPREKIAVHFHDTYGQAIANIYAALERGITVVDCSVSGLGGCPYAQGATGNVATEDVLYLLEGLNIKTGVDLRKLVEVSCFVANFLGKKPNSKVAQALINLS